MRRWRVGEDGWRRKEDLDEEEVTSAGVDHLHARVPQAPRCFRVQGLGLTGVMPSQGSSLMGWATCFVGTHLFWPRVRSSGAPSRPPDTELLQSSEIRVQVGRGRVSGLPRHRGAHPRPASQHHHHQVTVRCSRKSFSSRRCHATNSLSPSGLVCPATFQCVETPLPASSASASCPTQCRSVC